MPSTILPQPQTDYRGFRLSRINSPEYRHLYYLLFWPIFGIRYLLIENFHPTESYHVIECALDHRIPFAEGFVIAYYLWFLLLWGMHLYTLLRDVDAFRRYSRMLIFCMGISTLTFLVFPSQQNLRPEQMPRDNVLTSLVAMLYSRDTNTNVFPSEHAIGSGILFLSSLHTRGLHSPVKTTLWAIVTLLTCLSTVFLKQHSVLDLVAAVPVCLLGYWVCYGRKKDAQTV